MVFFSQIATDPTTWPVASSKHICKPYNVYYLDFLSVIFPSKKAVAKTVFLIQSATDSNTPPVARLKHTTNLQNFAEYASGTLHLSKHVCIPILIKRYRSNLRIVGDYLPTQAWKFVSHYNIDMRRILLHFWYAQFTNVLTKSGRKPAL